MNKNTSIAVAGTSYVSLSIATLLSQHHHVIAVDLISEKVEKINKHIIQYRMNILKSIWQKRNWTDGYLGRSFGL